MLKSNYKTKGERMNIIGKVTKESRIAMYKRVRDIPDHNYHFMPEWVLETRFDFHAPEQIVGMILNLSWGTYRPAANEMLVQKFKIENDRATYETKLVMSADGVRTIYLTVSGMATNRVREMYVCCEDYYGHLCDGLGAPLFEYEEPMFRRRGTNSRWTINMDEAN